MDERYAFEVEGKDKSFHQIKEILNAFAVVYDIKVVFGNKIPFWLFGFLY